MAIKFACIKDNDTYMLNAMLFNCKKENILFAEKGWS